jgi:hypothetical protein
MLPHLNPPRNDGDNKILCDSLFDHPPSSFYYFSPLATCLHMGRRFLRRWCLSPRTPALHPRPHRFNPPIRIIFPSMRPLSYRHSPRFRRPTRRCPLSNIRQQLSRNRQPPRSHPAPYIRSLPCWIMTTTNSPWTSRSHTQTRRARH